MAMKLLRNLGALLLVAASTASATLPRFKNPVITRLYESHNYALADLTRTDGIRVNVTEVANALAALKPTYVSSLIYLGYNVSVTDDMKSAYHTVRDTVRAASPDCKFDIALSLNPQTKNGVSTGKPTYTDGRDLVRFMESVNDKIPLIDGWWCDFYDEAFKERPDWIGNATRYAHTHNQTIGGNVFGNIVPTGADAVAFVDKVVSPGHFDFRPNEVAALKHNNAGGAALLGHLQSNPQNGDGTESMVYTQKWNSTQRADYQDYWLAQGAKLDFTYMLPVFYPIYPGAYAFNPLTDKLPGHGTLYNYIKQLSLQRS